MRIASLQPSVSVTLAALGRLEAVCACTKYCAEVVPGLVGAGVPVLQDSWSFDRAGELERLLATRPELVMVSVPYRLESLAAVLKAGVAVMALAPRCLADIYGDIRLIGRQVEACAEAEVLIEEMRAAIAAVECKAVGLPRIRVYCEEWGKPLIHSQGWVAELVAAAGGEFVGVPGAHTTAETVLALDPDVLVFAWCGAGDRVPLERVIAQRGWEGTQAVRSGRVYCVPDEYLNTPAPTLLEGLRCLAGVLQPEAFAADERVRRLRA